MFEYLFARTWIMMMAAGILFASILMTQSRTGMAVAILGISAYLGLFAMTRKRRRFIMAGVAAIVVCACAIFGIGGDGTLDHLSLLPDAASERYAVYEHTVDGIKDTPWSGRARDPSLKFF